MNVYVSNLAVPRKARNKRIYTHYVGRSYYESGGGGVQQSETDISLYILKSDVPYDIDFGYNDFTLGTTKIYPLDLKAQKPYTIKGIDLRCDTGTLTGFAVKINGVSVTGLSNLTINTTITETLATALNTVELGDLVTIELSTGYTGTPTVFDGKLLRQLL